MTDLHDAALRAGFWSQIAARASELKDKAREELRALPFGDSKAAKVGDQILCKASWNKGRESINVTDSRALLEWVKQHHPTEIVESVNPAYVKTFKAVEGIVIDSNGEPVPGMELKAAEPYISVRSEKEAPFLVAQLLSSGRMSLDGPVPALGQGVIDVEVVVE
jgi:hypothetical protein